VISTRAEDALHKPHKSQLRAVTRVGALATAFALSSALMACRSDAVNGDAPPPPIVDKYGGGTHISSRLKNDDGTFGFYGPAPWYDPTNINSSNCVYPPSLVKNVTGVTVVAVDTWDETGNGSVGTVYVQDSVGLTDWQQIPIYAGTSMFDPTYSPPDLKPLAGDVLDIAAVYEEFAGPSTYIFPLCETLPQLTGAASFRFLGSVPPPVQIEPPALASYAGAREYESMLVTVNNVTIVANGIESSGRYTADVEVPGTAWQIDDELFDLPHQYPLNANQKFASVTGIVTYFGSYHLAPRSLEDFTFVGGGHPTAINADAGAPVDGGSDAATNDGGGDGG
jgi:hypothetical protein